MRLSDLPRVRTVMAARDYRSLAHRLASKYRVMVDIRFVERGGGFPPIQPVPRPRLVGGRSRIGRG